LSYAQDLYSRWLMLKAYEIHGSDDQPNYIWSDGTYTRINEVAAPDPGDVSKIGTAREVDCKGEGEGDCGCTFPHCPMCASSDLKFVNAPGVGSQEAMFCNNCQKEV